MYHKLAWKIFREKILTIDNHCCTQCQRAGDDVKLQVHHKYYITGHLPWEYKNNACTTLCSSCHAKHHGILKPTIGWSFVGVEDLASLKGYCSYCMRPVRYMFFIHHVKWGYLNVGRICCDRLTQSMEASNKYQKEKRKLRFISSKRWEATKKGYKLKYQNIFILIYRSELTAPWKIKIDDQLGRKKFPKIEEAKALVFELIDSAYI